MCGGAVGAAQASGAAEEADGEAEEDEGPKAELKLGEDSTLLFKEPAKLFFKGKNGVSFSHFAPPAHRYGCFGILARKKRGHDGSLPG